MKYLMLTLMLTMLAACGDKTSDSNNTYMRTDTSNTNTTTTSTDTTTTTDTKSNSNNVFGNVSGSKK